MPASTTPSGKPVPPRERKVALMGSRNVGKSSLAVQIVEGHFVDSYYPTIEDTFEKDMTFNGMKYKLVIYDTAGQDEFSLLHKEQASGLHGWALVYSVTSRASFDMVSVIRDKILDYGGLDSASMVLIGNKSDLNAQRVIKAEEGQALARKWNCAWIETSARNNENVDRACVLLLDQMEKALNPQPAQKEGGCTIS